MIKLPKHLLILFTSTLVVTAVFAQNQREDFNAAKLHLANHKLQEAIPILEKLWGADPKNANLNYLLGLCYVKEDKEIQKAVGLLEEASKLYVTDYQSGSNKERRAPEYVYYYLTIAYAKNGQCEKALGALNKFYQVYSYSDEYYLVDGQKWVRECNLEKNGEESLELASEVTEEEEALEPPVEEEPVEEVEEKKLDEEVVKSQKEDPAPEPVDEPTPEVEEKKEPEPKVEPKPDPIPEPKVEPTPEPEIAEVKEEVMETELTEEEKAGQEIIEEIKERREPQMKERLIPFSDWENLRTREINYTTLSSQYGVQVAALIDLKPTREFEDLKNVEVYVDENGIFRYVIGRFPYRGQAESLKDKLIEKGYKDAFIVDINQPTYAEEVLGIGASNIDWHIEGDVDYRVQIGAFAALLPSTIAEKYLEVEGIREYHQNGLTILTVTGFDTYAKAVTHRDMLKEKGIEDAFIVAFNRGIKIPLREAIEYTAKQPIETPNVNDKKSRKADF